MVNTPFSELVARDVMTRAVASVSVDATLRQIAKILVEKGISGVPVVDAEGFPIGMVTESDLIAAAPNDDRKAGRERWLTRLAEGEPLSAEFLAHLDSAERAAREVMASPVVTINETTPLPEIARLFTSYRIKRLPVVRQGRMVGIVSRVDLVRQIAEEPAAPIPASHHGGLLSAAVASLEERFTQPDPPPPAAPATAEPPKQSPVTANAFRGLMEAFGDEKVQQRKEERRAEAERRKAAVEDMIEHHIKDEAWREILRRAQAAAKTGQKDMLLLRFPCELCSDGGRAINAALPDWPETLRGEAAEIYLHWERDLKPNGFRLMAQVLDFPGGIPGDVGLILGWGG